MKGRKRKPNAIRELQGNAGRRPVPAEPSFPSGNPDCPSHLCDEAKAEWARVVSEVGEVKLLKRVDRGALMAYCSVVAVWMMAEAEIKSRGIMYDANGLLKVNPAVRIAQDSRQQMKAFQVEFGFTPVSRSKVASEPEQDKDPMEEFLGGGGMRLVGQA
jgi:P27 family predicted phage terminase small subunit